MDNSVQALASNFITTGYEEGKLKPDTKLSHQHFVVFLAKALIEGQGLRYVYMSKQ